MTADHAPDESFGDFVVAPNVPPTQTSHLTNCPSIAPQGGRFQETLNGQPDIMGFGPSPSTASSSASKDEDLLMIFDAEDDVGSSPLDFFPGNPSSAMPPSRAQHPLSPRQNFVKQYTTLMPYLHSLYHHSSSSLLFTDPNLTSRHRAELLATLFRLLSNPFLAPARYFRDSTLARNLQSAIDLFEASLLSEFERADERRDEEAMRSSAALLWALGSDGSSVIQVFVTKREIFYDTRFNPLDNLV